MKRIKLNISNKTSGFTIIEVMIFTLIFSLFLLLATQLFLTIKSVTANSASMANLQQNMTRVFSDVNQTIRGAEEVTFPTAKGAGSSLNLNSGQIVYQLSGGVMQKVIGGQAYDLTDAGVTISSLIFENVGEATQSASVKVNMTFDSNYLLEGGRTVSEDMQTTLTLR